MTKLRTHVLLGWIALSVAAYLLGGARALAAMLIVFGICQVV